MHLGSTQALQAFQKISLLESAQPKQSIANELRDETSSRTTPNSPPEHAPAAQIKPRPLVNPRDLMLLQNREVSVEERADYERLLSEYTAIQKAGGNPLDFLRNLSSDGLDLLKKVHSFPAGMRVDVEGMNKEEAINFIVPDSRQVDLNNDGLIGSANGSKMFRFPPPNAPQDVKDAWKEAMDGLPEKDRLLAQGLFLVVHVQANITYDTAGNPVGIRSPDDPAFRNPYAEQNFSYSDMTEKMLSHLENTKGYYSPEQYEWKKDILSRFAKALENDSIT